MTQHGADRPGRPGRPGGTAPAFRFLSMVAIGFGALYAALGATRLLAGDGQGGLLLGFGVVAAAVGAAVLRWMR